MSRRQPLPLEVLEPRRLLSTIIWGNDGGVPGRRGDPDQFGAVFGPYATIARADVRQAIQDWEQVIANFDYTNVGTSGNATVSNTFLLSVNAADLAPGILGEVDESNTATDQSKDISSNGHFIQVGKPYVAAIVLDNNGDGHGWYFDPTPADNSKFNQNVTPFSAQANLGGREDFFTTVLREIGQAIGLDANQKHEDFGRDAGNLGQDPTNPRFELFGVDFYDRNTNQFHGTLFTQNDGGGLYTGPFSQHVVGFGFDHVIPDDLMDAQQPVDTRELISNFDVGLLDWGYNNDPFDFTQPAYTMNYPSDLGMTFLSQLEPNTRVLTIHTNPTFAADADLTDDGSTLTVKLDGVPYNYSLQSISSIQIDSNAANATVEVPSDLFGRSVQITGDGTTMLTVADSGFNSAYTLGTSRAFSVTPFPGSLFTQVMGTIAIARSQRTRLFGSSGLPSFARETITYRGVSQLTVVGDTNDQASVLGTLASTRMRVFGIGSVAVGNAGSTGGIAGPVDVTGFAETRLGVANGATTLTIDDSADRAQHTVQITATSLTGLAPAPITYHGGDLASLTIQGGSAANTYMISDTPQNGRRDLAMTLNTGALADTVDIGGTSSNLTLDEGAGQNTLDVNMAHLYGILNANSTGGRLKLTANDQADTTHRDATLSTATIPTLSPRPPFRTRFISFGLLQGLGNGQILYDPSTVDALTIQTGESNPQGGPAPGNTVTIANTNTANPAQTTSILLNGHNDIANVESTQGSAYIYGVAGHNDVVNVGVPQFGQIARIANVFYVNNAYLNVNSSADTGPSPMFYTVEQYGISLNGQTRIYYGALNGLRLTGPAAGSIYNIHAVPGQDLIVNGGSSNDTFKVASSSGSLDGMFGSILLNGADGQDVLNVTDTTASAAEAYTIDTQTSLVGPATTLARQGGPSIAAHGIGRITLNGADEGGTFAINGLGAGTSLALNGGAGNDTFHVGSNVARNAPISVDGGGSVNTLDYSTYASATPSTPGTLPAGIVSWYKAEGNANDSIGNNNGVATNVTYGAGEVGQAFEFHNGYVRVPDAPSLDSPMLTVEAWVKATAPGPYAYIVDKGINGTVAASYGLYTGFTGGLFFYVYNGESAAVSPDAGARIWDGQWHHVAGTYDGNTVRLYVDGKQAGNGTPATGPIDYNLPGGNDVAIGSYLGPGVWNFNGPIDELSIYNRALSASEIQAIFSASSIGKTAAPPPSTQGVEVNLQTGTATGLAGGIIRIQKIVGSPGNDILVGNGGNTLNGLGGQDLLIAGPSTSTLTGSGADILIGGQTADDMTMAALEAVLNSWGDPSASSATRVARLLIGPLSSSRVKSNKQHNTLLGGSGPNLFLTSSTDTTNASNNDVSSSI
jgi:hypothetical protein